MLSRPQFAFIFVDGFNTRVNMCEPSSLPNRLLLYKLLPGSLRGQLQQRGRELRENEGMEHRNTSPRNDGQVPSSAECIQFQQYHSHH